MLGGRVSFHLPRKELAATEKRLAQLKADMEADIWLFPHIGGSFCVLCVFVLAATLWGSELCLSFFLETPIWEVVERHHVPFLQAPLHKRGVVLEVQNQQGLSNGYAQQTCISMCILNTAHVLFFFFRACLGLLLSGLFPELHWVLRPCVWNLICGGWAPHETTHVPRTRRMRGRFQLVSCKAVCEPTLHRLIGSSQSWLPAYSELYQNPSQRNTSPLHPTFWI